MPDKKRHSEDDMEEDDALLGKHPMPDMLADEDEDPMEDNSLPIDVMEDE